MRVSQAKSERCLFFYEQFYWNTAVFMFCLWLLCPRMAALTSGDITLRLCQDCMASRAWNTVWPFPQKVCRLLISGQSESWGGIYKKWLKKKKKVAHVNQTHKEVVT